MTLTRIPITIVCKQNGAETEGVGEAQQGVLVGVLADDLDRLERTCDRLAARLYDAHERLLPLLQWSPRDEIGVCPFCGNGRAEEGIHDADCPWDRARAALAGEAEAVRDTPDFDWRAWWRRSTEMLDYCAAYQAWVAHRDSHR